MEIIGKQKRLHCELLWHAGPLWRPAYLESLRCILFRWPINWLDSKNVAFLLIANTLTYNTLLLQIINEKSMHHKVLVLCFRSPFGSPGRPKFPMQKKKSLNYGNILSAIPDLSFWKCLLLGFHADLMIALESTQNKCASSVIAWNSFGACLFLG